MYKCKSTMCESDSLKNSAYCFEHYQKPEPSPASALMRREKVVKKLRKKLRGRANRVRSDRDSQFHNLGMGLIASYALGLSRRKDAEVSAEAEADKNAKVMAMLAPAVMSMVFSMMKNDVEKEREGDDGAL